MKSFVFAVLVLVFSASIAIAGPNLQIYRYQRGNIGDVKNLPADLILGNPVRLDAWIKDDAKWPQGKKIALLIHGFPVLWVLTKGTCRNDMNALADHLSKERVVDQKKLPAYDAVYAIEYPSHQHLLATANVLANIVSNRTSDWSKGDKIDVFAHSMGGLVARTAIECPKQVLGTNNIADLVSHLVMMGTPQTGFYELNAARKLLGVSPELEDLNAKGSFLNQTLNSSSFSRVKTIDYYVIYGTCSYLPVQYRNVPKHIGDSLEAAHDGLVPVSSSSYSLSAFCHLYQFKPLELNHEYLVKDPSVFNQIDLWMAADKWFGKVPIISAPALPQIEKYTGGLPIVIGKTRAEVIKLFGTNALFTEPTNYKTVLNRVKDLQKTLSMSYMRNQFNKVNCITNISFLPFGCFPDLNPGEKLIMGQAQAARFQHLCHDGPWIIFNIPLREVLPKEIFESEPAEICWCYGSDPERIGLVIVWKYFGNTYLARLEDSRRNLADKLIIKLGPGLRDKFKIKKNQNTLDFRNAESVMYYVQIKGDVNLFGKPLDFYQYHACPDDDSITCNDRGFFYNELMFFKFVK